MESFSTFQNFSFNFESLKQTEGYIGIDSLNLNDSSDAGWMDIILKQMRARDRIIDVLYDYFQVLLKHGKILQMDLEYWQYKNEKSSKEIKHLNKLLRRERRLTKKLDKKKDKKSSIKLLDVSVKSTQTDASSTIEWDWYYYYKQQYEYDSYNANNYNTDKTTATVASDNENEIEDTDVEIKEVLTQEEEMEENVEIIKSKLEDNLEELIHEDVSEENFKIMKLEPEECFDGKESEKEECSSSSNIDKGSDSSEIADTREERQLPSLKKALAAKKEMRIPGWTSSNIKEEVETLAEEVTTKLGYVFVEEIGMYYDHTSGYYYDHKTSLYYDGKSGTYFYYNHETSKYEFYANVSPTEDATMESPPHLEEKKGRKKKSKEEDGEGEEGSESEEEQSEEETSSAVVTSECRGDIAPSLRLMVLNGRLRGSLHVVTLDGGTVGREGDIDVLLKDVSVSKVHAAVSYSSAGPADHHYFIRDLGSSNGTLVRGRRLSEAKAASEPVEIGHGWEIQCGDVVLACHVHPGLLTCNECEPGLVAATGGHKKARMSKQSKARLEKDRRRQNKALRKKFSLEWFESEPPKLSPSYKDRAGERREVVGSDNPYEKTQVASADTTLSKENKGFKLLQRMGWSEGEGVGAHHEGILEPIVPKFVSGRAGLGSSSPPRLDPLSNPKKKVYRDMLRVTKQRYESSSGGDDPDPPCDVDQGPSMPSLFKPIRFNSASSQSANGS